MASKEAYDLDNLLMMYSHGIDLPDMLLSTNYVFDFDHFIAESFNGGEENISSFNSNPIN